MNKGFKHWFINVYWYHYKWVTLVGIAVIIVLVSLIHSVVTRTEPDITVVLATESPMTQMTAEPFETFIGEIVGDVNQDGSVSVELQALNINTDTQIGSANRMLLTALLSREDVHLYILDLETAEDFESGDFFTPIEGQSLPYTRVDAALKHIGVPLAEDTVIVAGLGNRTGDRRDEAAKVLAALIGKNDGNAD